MQGKPAAAHEVFWDVVDQGRVELNMSTHWWEEDDIETMLGVLEVCEYETTKMIIANTRKHDLELWPSVLNMLESMFMIVGFDTTNLMVGVITLFYC